MEVELDIETIEDAGFDRYLRIDWTEGGVPMSKRYLMADSLGGGTIGKEGIIYLGSQLFKLDGSSQRIVINDGANDRILIGKF